MDQSISSSDDSYSINEDKTHDENDDLKSVYQKINILINQ